MGMDTPGGMVNHLLTYITDDSAIAAYVRREFSSTITAADVAKQRRLAPRPRMMQHEPLATNESAKWSKGAEAGSRSMAERLARATR